MHQAVFFSKSSLQRQQKQDLNDSVVKSACCSYRKLEFSFQKPYHSSQQPVHLDPHALIPTPGLCGHLLTCVHTHTNTYTYMNK